MMHQVGHMMSAPMRMMGMSDKDHKEAATFIHETVSTHKVVVFSKTDCAASNNARQILDRELGAGNYKVVEVNARADHHAILKALKDLSGNKHVPQVFIGGKYVGGGSDITSMQKSGQLTQLLKAQGL